MTCAHGSCCNKGNCSTISIAAQMGNVCTLPLLSRRFVSHMDWQCAAFCISSALLIMLCFLQVLAVYSINILRSPRVLAGDAASGRSRSIWRDKPALQHRPLRKPASWSLIPLTAGIRRLSFPPELLLVSSHDRCHRCRAVEELAIQIHV